MMINQQIFCFYLFLISFQSCIAFDTLISNQTLLDNGTTLVSASETFELGFFSPYNSRSRYVGIWFKNVAEQTVIWVANKDTPLTDSFGILTITTAGNIVITNNQSIIVWTTKTSSGAVSNPILQLLDSGNLVLKTDANNNNSYLWQSFDYPCDSLVPGMKLGWDLRANQEWYLTSWKSLQDPSPGDYTYRMDPRGLFQAVLRKGSKIECRSGSWDGVRFGGDPVLHSTTVMKPIIVFDADNIYYEFENIDVSIISRFVLNQSGAAQHLKWSETSNQWIDVFTLGTDTCDNYAKCGSFGVCSISHSPICDCLAGFTPRLRQDWAQFDWSGGCARKSTMNCSMSTKFRKFSGLKLPDASNFLVNRTTKSAVECEESCLRNCSCVAYAMTEASGCMAWFGDLLDMRTYSNAGQDLFIRIPASDLDTHSKSKRTIVAILVSVFPLLLLLPLISCYLYRRKTANGKGDQRPDNRNQDNSQSIGDEDLELPSMDIITISAATNAFSSANKIGEGGFGPVYKGVLSTGKEIAAKRLSKDSGQGLKEFKNEVIFIAKLQHRNLVRLLGCCIHGEERILIYEYMPNKSLDWFIFSKSLSTIDLYSPTTSFYVTPFKLNFFIFDRSVLDRTKDSTLDWRKRFDIIVGIARGLLYLHRDSRLRIIHRDLKASNILLDSEMNPKISDFGLARTFGGDQNQDRTKQVIGTYGYMAPEYVMGGLFSVKSDVFSFGVLVLEIISGKRNRLFFYPDHDLNLLGHAWKLWNEGNPLDLLDASMVRPNPATEVLRCIHVGLLCVQQRPDDRPTMPTVLLMLDSEQQMLPIPKEPGFYYGQSLVNADASSKKKDPCTSNEVTETLLQGR